jgi:hypothetical protein
MPRRQLRFAFLVPVLAMLLPGRAGAGPPYETDDPETPPLRTWEINLAFVLQEGTDPASYEAPTFDFNYGLTRNIQVGIGVPIVTMDPIMGEGVTGFGDAAMSVKWRFLDERGARPQMAIHPEVSFPTGSVSAGLGSGEFTWLLPLSVQESWGPWTNFDHAGWVIQSAGDAPDYAIYGAALTRDLSKTVTVGAELFGNGPTEPAAPSDLGWHLGLTWEISERVEFIGTGGHGLQPGAGATAYVGTQLHLGNLP